MLPDVMQQLTTSRRRRIARAVLGSLLGAAAFAGARRLGWLDGVPALLVVALTSLMIPSSRQFGRRILYVGLIGLGWSQVLWWWPTPFDRITLVASLGFGSAIGWIAWQDSIHSAARRALPLFHPTDAISVLVAGFGIYSMRDWLFRADGPSALALLIPGWDTSSHFNMFHMIWANGRTMDGLAPPGAGDVWQYHDYPQAFHSTAVTVADLMWPRAVADMGASLIAYNRATAIVLIAAVTTVTAGICSLPGLRRRWELAAPISMFVASAFFLGPGAAAIRYGFASFVLPCALLGAAMCVSLTMTRIAQPLPLLALCGAFVGVAHGWILLLTLAVPVGVAAILPFGRTEWRAPLKAWWTSSLIVALTGLATYRAIHIVMASANSATLAVPGGIWPPPLGVLVAVGFTTTALAVRVVTRRGPRSFAARRTTVRIAALATLLPISAAVAFYLAALQIHLNGAVGYYFWKFLIGSELTLVVLIALSSASLTRTRQPFKSRTSVLAALVVTLLLSLASTQLFGYTGPTSPKLGLASNEPNGGLDTWFAAGTRAGEASAHAILAAAYLPAAHASDAAFLSAGAPGAMNPINAQQWFLALRGQWVHARNVESTELDAGQDSLGSTIPVAENWLRTHSGPLIVTPELRSALVSDARTAQFQDRVTTW